jgi:gliding motility-associated-like protein
LYYALLFTGLVFFHAGFSQTLITTVAGMADQAGFTGDGGLATKARLNFPEGICFDPAGNMYIADYYNNRVRKVDGHTGIISTMAGNGTSGFSGDGGPAINASFNHPYRLFADGNNHLFISDYGNLRVRMVDLGTGIINTIAGDGTQNYVNGGLAVNGGMLPYAFAMDKAGNLYISQHNPPLATNTGNIISKLDMKTGIITTVAGNQGFGFGGDGGPALNATLWNPTGMAFDASGNLYFADQVNSRIRRIDASTGIITTIAGGGTIVMPSDGVKALDVMMNNPLDVLVDANGDILISDESAERIRKVDMKTGTMSTIVGTGYVGTGPDCVSPTSETLNDCIQMAFDGQGNLHFCESTAQRVRKVFTATTSNASISISTSDNPTCAGATATFTAQVTNGGSGAAYQWKVNGQPDGGNTPTYAATFKDGDVVSCELNYTAAGTCGAASTVKSNTITVQVSALATPGVSISTPYTTICSGGSAEFMATAVAAGVSPVYQWLVNGNPVGGNSASFTALGLADNDVVQCRVNADPTAKCTSQVAVTSAPVTMKVLSQASPAIQVVASTEQICPGDDVLFTAAVQNAGDGYSFQWLVNGSKVGENKDVYSDATLRNGDIVSCALTAGSNTCMSGQQVSSNKTIITVRQLPIITLGFTDTTVMPGVEVKLRAVIEGSVQSWQWSPSGEMSDVYSLTPVTVPLSQTTSFRFTASSPEGCSTYKDALVRVFYKLSMPNSFTPNGDGRNDVFRIPPAVTIELEEFAVFDRWGNRLFSTRDTGNGWDGTWKGQACAPGVYVYVVKGKTIKGEVLSKGTVTLVR